MSRQSRTLRWWDGVGVTFSLPAALFISLGPSVGALGAWTALSLWGAMAAVAVLYNGLYVEMGAMFADKSGGIALYANEAWRTRAARIGPLATYAYWFSWATLPAILGLYAAQVAMRQFWPTSPYILNLRFVHVDASRCIALIVVLFSWVLGMTRLRLTMTVVTLAGALLMIPVAIFALCPLTAHAWSTASFSWRIGTGLVGTRTALAWCFVMAWSAYAVEAPASFIPEYRETVRDTQRALRVSALLLLVVFLFAPLGIGGLIGERALAGDSSGFLPAATRALFGGGGTASTLDLIAAVLVRSVVGTAPAGRTLYQSACEGLTIRQFGVLSRDGLPVRAVTLQFAINVALILFVGTPLSVIVAGNVGYVLAHVLAVCGFLLLRRDRPNAHRPIRLSEHWRVVAAVLAVFDALLLIAGITGSAITGYGGLAEFAIAADVLAMSQVLYSWRRFQDR
ncbi:MAG TPA: APC family permease [Candidatus Binataceae bacterium]|nr:APC family permease [Candidatus Binataceae bacterium]